MIPRNELRIGNRVLIDGVSNNVDLHDMKYYDQLYPIPITEDWLIMLGFEKRDHRYVDDYYCLSIYLSIDCYGFELTSDDRCDRHFIKYIKYVHELQNLYFALTGKELKLKQNA